MAEILIDSEVREDSEKFAREQILQHGGVLMLRKSI